jgi:hypothetical protein
MGVACRGWLCAPPPPARPPQSPAPCTLPLALALALAPPPCRYPRTRAPWLPPPSLPPARARPRQNRMKRALGVWWLYTTRALRRRTLEHSAGAHCREAILRRCFVVFERMVTTMPRRRLMTRRLFGAWKRIARKLHSLHQRVAVMHTRLDEGRTRLVWCTWRRERVVQLMMATHGVGRLQGGTGQQLGLLTVFSWQGEADTSLLIRCWRNWRRSIHRCRLAAPRSALSRARGSVRVGEGEGEIGGV